VEPTSSAGPAEEALRTMDLYYRLLNCGFKLPVSGGTASGVKPTPLGYDRVYVHLSGRFSYEQWFRDLKRGRSFATNGPMLLLTVNGREPGETIDVGDKRENLTVRAQATSARDLDRLEVVWKGKVIKTVAAPENTQKLELTVEHAPEGTGWFVVRAFEKPTATVRFAHTSPVYVQAGKDRGVEPDAADSLIASIDRSIKYYRSLPVHGPGAQALPRGPAFRAEAHREAMIDMFQKAQRVFIEAKNP
jgi:hypothetical protein